MQRRRGAIPGLLRRLALCTLAGAVVTWAVAWGCALWGPTIMDWVNTDDPWPRGTPIEWQPPSRCVRSSSHWQTERNWLEAEDETGRVATTLESGVPFRSMKTSTICDHPRAVKLTGFQPFRWMRPRHDWQKLPVELVPLGFTLNTALAALVLLGMVEGVGFARRRRRASRGLCPACGYDRRGIDAGGVCPECGRG